MYLKIRFSLHSLSNLIFFLIKFMPIDESPIVPETYIKSDFFALDLNLIPLDGIFPNIVKPNTVVALVFTVSPPISEILYFFKSLLKESINILIHLLFTIFPAEKLNKQYSGFTPLANKSLTLTLTNFLAIN